MPIGDIYQLRVATDEPPQCAINILHFSCTGQVGPGATLGDIAGLFASRIAARWKALIAAPATFRGVGCRLVWPTPTIEVPDTADAGAGTAGTVGLPPQTCGIVSIRNGLPGRHGRGRMYLPFPAADDNMGNGIPSAGYAIRMALLVGTLLTPFTTGGGGASTTLAWSIYNKAAHTSALVTSQSLAAGWGTQRRRGFFGRPNPPPF